MKFVTFVPRGSTLSRFGFLLNDGRIADLEGACAARLARDLPLKKAGELAAVLAPPDALSFLDGGDLSLDAARKTLAFVDGAVARGEAPTGPEGETIVFAAAAVALKAPLLRPRKFIAAGKNFSDHRAEMGNRGGEGPRQPVAFAQMTSTIVGPDAAIPYPQLTKKLDYEVEVAVVIGKRARNIDAKSVWDHVFGYTVFNDISARDVYTNEGAAGIPLLGKNLAAFAPIGPYLVTRDEIAVPSEMKMQSRVNGQIRQDSNLSYMIFGIEEVVAFWSQIGLEPGDVLTSGTPKGVAAGRKPGQEPWWLKPGDVVEAEVSGLGILRNTIV
jgi:acylpyruvate hydrolase